MLQGSLDTFGLGDVLAFLASTGTTGRLHLNGDRGTGSLWLGGGEVIAGMAANVPVTAEVHDVVFELLRYAGGDFAFAPGEAPAEPGPPHAVGPLLARAGQVLAEWRELTAVVPSLAHRVALLRELVDEQVVLDRAQWRSVLAIGPGCTVGALGEALGMGEVPVLRLVCDLLDRGLVEVLEPHGSPAGAPAAAPLLAAPVPAGALDEHRWQGGGDVPAAPAVPAAEPAAPAAAPAGDPLLDQLGGLSFRAAQAVSEAARGDVDDSVLMSLLRDER